MKTILFPTDFTTTSHHALAWAKFFARKHNATIVVLHVYQLPLPDTTMPAMGDLGMGTFAATDLEQISRENLDKFVIQLQSDGFTIETDWRMGNVEDQIINSATDHNADLIVTGRSDLTNFFDRLIGSAATDVARAATCPVLVVPNAADEQTNLPVQIKQMVYATQLEFDERAMMAQVLTVAQTVGADLTLVRVKADNQPDLYDDTQFLGQLQRQFGDLPLNVDTVRARTVSAGLTDYLDQHPTDLLVMTTREHSFLENLINPSETERMVTRSIVPVLVLHKLD